MMYYRISKNEKNLFFGKKNCPGVGSEFKVCQRYTSRPSNSIFGILFFVFVRKKSDFAEFKVPLIYRKHVPLLHNKVLILCDEGAGLVAV